MGTKTALLIGCNYPGKKSKLAGPKNDVDAIKKLLIDVKGFEEDDIKIMLDSFEKEDPMWPKKRKILNQLEAICSGREAGDVVVLHFSGHGARLKTDDPDEEDGKDECIIAANMKPIRDDQLKSCIDKLPDGVNFTMIADCCHSGGMLDHQEILIEGDKADGDGELPDVSSLCLSDDDGEEHGDTELKGRKISEEELEAQLKADGKQPKKKNRKKYKRNVTRDIGVLVTGCQAHERSSDCKRGKQSYGAMTKTLDKVVRANPEASSYDTVKLLRAEMKKKGYKQNPCLECALDLAGTPFIC